MPKLNTSLLTPFYIPADSGFGQEWYLQNRSYPGMDLNVVSVWDEYKGSGVKVGVLDDGIDYKNPDLAPNYSTALDYNFYTGAADAYISSGSYHGTAVAGVIAADDNGIGSVGVAPDATLVGYEINFSSSSLSQYTNALLMAAKNVDVLNNSWGYSSYFYDNDRSGTFSGFFSALQNLAENGRGGLGTSTVFAAGNYRSSGDNVNYHNIPNSPYTIAVGAIGSNGKYASYSTPGAAVLVSAPGSSIYTTDNMGSSGFSSGSYATVSGTSFAAPALSGVIALMLQANPHLGYRDVQEILAYSARNSDPSHSDWQVNGAGNWNNTGLHFSHQYGFGLVDAHAAVRLAESWNLTSTYATLDTVSYSSSPNLAIPDLKAVTSSITVSRDITIDHVVVSVDLSHGDAGQLQLILVAPDGTQSVLMNYPGAAPGSSSAGSTATFSGFDFTTVADWGESSLGTWTLKAYDRISGTTGTLKSWSITFMGDDASAGSTYIYTDEYAKAGGGTLLSDLNGGIDTINASAVTGNSVIDLSGASSGAINGKAFTVDSRYIVENAWSGDGNDILYGNAANNEIHAGRGDDRIYASAGNDVLDGGQGTDTVYFTSALDQFAVQIVSAMEMIVSGAAGLFDRLMNFEWFSFGGHSYSLQDMINYAAGSPPPEPPPTNPENPPPPPPPPSEPPVQDLVPVTLDFKVVKENGLTAHYVVASDKTGESFVSSAQLKIGGNASDHALAIGRSNDLLSISVADSASSRFKSLTVTADASTGYDISGISSVDIEAQKAVNGITASLHHVQEITLYAANGADRISIEAENRDGNTSTSYNDLRAYLYGGDDIVTVTGNNPYFKSYVDLGAGNDTYKSSVTGQETVYGQDGNDIIQTADGNDKLYGQSGNDIIHAGGGNDYLYGDIGNDTLYGDAGNDYLNAGSGNDSVYGGDGADKLYGGDDADLLDGGNGDDVLYGGSGNDTLYTSAGTDSLYGGAGADTFVLKGVNPGNTVEDFSVSQGDRLDIADILTGFDEGKDALSDFLQLSYDKSKGETAVKINADGHSGGAFETVAVLHGNFSTLDVDKLHENGQILTAHLTS